MLVSAVTVLAPDCVVLGRRVEAPEHDPIAAWGEGRLAVTLGSWRARQRPHVAAVCSHQCDAASIRCIQLEDDPASVGRPVRMNSVPRNMCQLMDAAPGWMERVELETARCLCAENDPSVLAGRCRGGGREGH